MAQRPSSSFPRIALVAAVGCVVVGLAVIALRARSADSSATGPAVAASGAASTEPSLEALLAGSAAPEPSLDPTQPKGAILGKTSLMDAIAVARPFMMNTAGRLDTGSALLSLWAAERLTWDAIESLPETSPALFRKDPDAERGKRFCIAGSIAEIRAEKTLAGRLAEDRPLPLIERQAGSSMAAPADSASGGIALGSPPNGVPGVDWAIGGGGKVYFAVLKEKTEPVVDTAAAREVRRTNPKVPLVVEVIAVKSSGSLVEGSDARACGVLTGVTMPASSSTSSGSDAMEHRIVGMFDLPENHGGSELAHHGG